MELLEECNRIKPNFVLLLLEHLLHLQLLLHLRLIDALDELTLPLVTILIEEHSLSMHLMILPLSLVDTMIKELVPPHTVMHIVLPLPTVLGS
jgi:hypothetical protein